MRRSMVDIQSATTEIRRGKPRKNKKQDENIIFASVTQSGHNNFILTWNHGSTYILLRLYAM